MILLISFVVMVLLLFRNNLNNIEATISKIHSCNLTLILHTHKITPPCIPLRQAHRKRSVSVLNFSIAEFFFYEIDIC